MSSRLTSFLYDLMRDHLTPGVVEELVEESVAIEVAYTNGYLAQYAFDMANRLCPPRYSQGGVVKDVLRTRFMLVRDGHSTPAEEADKVYAAITENDPLLSTGKGRNPSPPVSSTADNTVTRPYMEKALVQNLLMAFQQGHLTNEDTANRILQGVSSTPNAPLPSDAKQETQTAPGGKYGVFCEPLGHQGNPCWTSSGPQAYEEAVKEADFMNRSNPAWHYYAKPIR